MLKKITVSAALLACLACLACGPALAEGKGFTLQAPEALVQTGFLKHLLPRFSLKTGIRITMGPEAGEAAFVEAGADAGGTPVFKGGGTLWYLAKTDGPYTDAFAAWLVSDIGKRTVEAFAPEGTPMFSADIAETAREAIVEISGDAALGEAQSLAKCGRCHVVNDSNRMKAIGSTPSFALMRTFPDWQQRFEAFFTLKPHPSFTQVPEITESFAENLPPAIAPIEVTLDEIDAIVAYVATIPPADLGAPLQTQ